MHRCDTQRSNELDLDLAFYSYPGQLCSVADHGFRQKLRNDADPDPQHWIYYWCFHGLTFLKGFQIGIHKNNEKDPTQTQHGSSALMVRLHEINWTIHRGFRSRPLMVRLWVIVSQSRLRSRLRLQRKCFFYKYFGAVQEMSKITLNKRINYVVFIFGFLCGRFRNIPIF